MTFQIWLDLLTAKSQERGIVRKWVFGSLGLNNRVPYLLFACTYSVNRWFYWIYIWKRRNRFCKEVSFWRLCLREFNPASVILHLFNYGLCDLIEFTFESSEKGVVSKRVFLGLDLKISIQCLLSVQCLLFLQIYSKSLWFLKSRKIYLLENAERKGP